MTFTLTCIAAELSRALQLVSQVAGRDKMLPILRAVRITAKSGSASISATNMDHGATATIAADGDGVIYVDASMISVKAGAIRPDKPVTISSEDGKTATMVQGRTRYTLPLLDGSAFPGDMTEAVKADPVHIAAGPLIRAFTVAPDAINPSLANTFDMGALCDMSDGRFRVVSTTGKMISVFEAEIPPLPVSVVMPVNAMATIKGMFSGAETLNISATDRAVSISADGLTYRTKLIEGKYVDWAPVTAKWLAAVPHTLTALGADVIDMLDRAAAIAEDKTKDGPALAARVVVSEGGLSVTARNRSGEDSADECECTATVPAEFLVSMSWLRKFIANIGAQRIRIRYSDQPNTPIVISPDEDGRDDYRIVMPMRA